jgi:Flp pilus assembly secretin CpaC
VEKLEIHWEFVKYTITVERLSQLAVQNVDLGGYAEATAQTITFAALTDRMSTDADFDLTATATSGMTVTFTSSTPSVCTVSGVTVSLVAAGTCTIVAAQSGGLNSGINYAVAPTVTRSFLSRG